MRGRRGRTQKWDAIGSVVCELLAVVVATRRDGIQEPYCDPVWWPLLKEAGLVVILAQHHIPLDHQ